MKYTDIGHAHPNDVILIMIDDESHTRTGVGWRD